MPNPFQSTQSLNLKKNKSNQILVLLIATAPIFAVPAMALELGQRGSSSANTALLSNAEKESASAADPHLGLELKPEKSTTSGLWSFGFGVGVISDNSPPDYLTADFDRLSGPGEGLIYNFTVARQIKEFDLTVGNRHLRPQLEVPFRFTLVDEKAEGIIPDFNLGLVGRWQDFPWNRYVYTTLSVGFGLSYSSPIWTADQQRHERDNRSKLKFWLPMEITLALPRYPNYQLTAFADHQSGGWLFDTGGVDAWGFGFRIVF